jgi:hypothetical protein
MIAQQLSGSTVATTTMQTQTPEQLGTQFVWELNNIKKDLEAILEMSREETLNFAPTLLSRMNVASARLKLFRKMLG